MYTAESKLLGDETRQRRLFVGKVNDGGLRLLNEVMVRGAVVGRGKGRSTDRERLERGGGLTPSFFLLLLLMLLSLSLFVLCAQPLTCVDD